MPASLPASTGFPRGERPAELMNILFYMPHTENAAAWLRDLTRVLPDASLRAWQPGDTAPADYAIVWRPPRDMLAGRDDLRAIFNLGAGVDAILALEHERPGTLPREALLVRLQDTGMGSQMAEYVTHAVLRYLRRLDEYAALQAERRWTELDPHPRETFTVGVLGLGVLGAQVAQAVAGFGIPVRGYSRSARQIDGISIYAGEIASDPQFDAFLDGVKLLVNLLPHTPDTHGVLNARTFSKLAHGAYLVNVARGAHLVESDLLAALDSGQIAAATLDVFHDEPLPDAHPFWRHPRVTVTPHISALTLRAESVAKVARDIAALERGESIGGVVDIERGY